MAIINISRQIGSLGDETAKTVADQLGYRLIDKDEIHRQVSLYKTDFSHEILALTQEQQPGIFDQLRQSRSVYNSLICSILYSVAEQGDVVIKGRGGNFLLANFPGVLSLRVIAPFDLRVSRLHELQPDPNLAAAFVRHIDQERDRFIRYLFQKEISDPLAYDVVINTRMFTLAQIVELIIAKARELDQTCPLNETTREQLRNLALAKRIEATIQKEVPESSHIRVSADKNGHVKVGGYISDTVEKDRINRSALKVKGVNSVQNQVLVMSRGY